MDEKGDETKADLYKDMVWCKEGCKGDNKCGVEVDFAGTTGRLPRV